MIKMEIKRSDFDRLMKKLDEPQRDQAIRTSLYQSAVYLTGWIKTKRLSGPRPQFLGVVTGRLRSSITATPATKSGNSYTAKIGTNVIYGHRHEYGTGGMPARPFMRPAIEDSQNIELVKQDLIRNFTKMLEA
jgi:HK97 gp10 family phage protein